MKWRGIYLRKMEWLVIIVVALVVAVCAVFWFGAGTVGDTSLCGVIP